MLDCVGFTFARICGILEMDRNINGLLCMLEMTVLSLYMPYCDPRPSCIGSIPCLYSVEISGRYWHVRNQ